VQLAEDGGRLHRPLIIRLLRLSLPDAPFDGSLASREVKISIQSKVWTIPYNI
jgi:hypothetical protein